jgi:hypothetical protein
LSLKLWDKTHYKILQCIPKGFNPCEHKKKVPPTHQSHNCGSTLNVIYRKLKGIVGAVVIFNHGLKFGIVFLVSDHQAHEKLIASKKKFFTIE